MIANQDSQKFQLSRPIFSAIEGGSADIFEQYKSHIDDNKTAKKPYHEGLPPIIKQISLDSRVGKDVEIFDKSQVSKSNIGRGVKIGARTKIVNSVILNNVTIGNE